MARSYSSTSPRPQLLSQSGKNIEFNPTTIESNTAASSLTQPVMYSKAASTHSPLHATRWQLEYIKYGSLPAPRAEPPTSLASDMSLAGTDVLPSSLYQLQSANSSSGTIATENTLFQPYINNRHRDEGAFVVEGEPPAKRFKNAAGTAISPP